MSVRYASLARDNFTCLQVQFFVQVFSLLQVRFFLDFFGEHGECPSGNMPTFQVPQGKVEIKKSRDLPHSGEVGTCKLTVISTFRTVRRNNFSWTCQHSGVYHAQIMLFFCFSNKCYKQILYKPDWWLRQLFVSRKRCFCWQACDFALISSLEKSCSFHRNSLGKLSL